MGRFLNLRSLSSIFFFIICSLQAFGMTEQDVVLGVGSIIKRVENAVTSIPYRPITSFIDSYTGIFAFDCYLGYKKQYLRQEIFTPVHTSYDGSHCFFSMQPTDVAPRKRQRILDKEIYDPDKARTSGWYRDYVLNQAKWINKPKYAIKFRRRFRMPMIVFQNFMLKIRSENWFPHAEAVNAIGQIGIPLEILVLGSLRYIGRGWTFDDLEESTGVHEETHRKFFHVFVKEAKERLYPEFVKEPDTLAEIENSRAEFTEAGFNGCIGSCDATHIIMEKCPGKLKNQHLGGKLTQTARAYQITVNHRRRILSSTVGLPGRWNDKTVVRFDSFITKIHDGELYGDIMYDLFKSDGSNISVKGLWILVDGGYLRWSSTIPPFKVYANSNEARWSKWAESMRKDVECTFGILKGRFRILKTGIRLHSFTTMDNIWFTCCALHNMLLEIDGLALNWAAGVRSDYEGVLGQHDSIGDVRQGLDHEVFARLRDPVNYDTSRPVTNAVFRNDHVATISRKRLPMNDMRDILVEHFNYLWARNAIRWPSRNGILQRR